MPISNLPSLALDWGGAQFWSTSIPSWAQWTHVFVGQAMLQPCCMAVTPLGRHRLLMPPCDKRAPLSDPHIKLQPDQAYPDCLHRCTLATAYLQHSTVPVTGWQ